MSLQETEFAALVQSAAQLEAVRANAPAWQTYVELAGRWAPVAGAILALIMFLRMLAKQKPEPVPVEVLSLPPGDAARALPNANNITPELLNELIRQKPANVGVALRNWVNDTAAPAPAGKN